MCKKIVKILSVILAVTTLFSIFSFAKKQEEPVIDISTPHGRIENSVLEKPATNDNFRYNIYTYYITITECLISNSNIVIPDTINDLPVYKIADNVFQNQATIKNVYLSDNIIEIGEKCFEGCVNMESCTLSKNLEIIGEEAFSGCVSLKSITIPGYVQYISRNTFSNCDKLTTVTFEKSDKKFYNDKGEEIGREINDYAFDDCYSLQTAWIPSDFVLIQEMAFSDSEDHLIIYGENRSAAAVFAADHLLDFVSTTEGEYNSLASDLIKEKTVKPGKSIEGYDWKIKLDKVITFDKSFNYVSKGTEKKFDIPEKQQLIVCCFVIKNVSGESKLFNLLGVKPSVDGYERKVSVYDGMTNKDLEKYNKSVCSYAESNGIIYGYVAFMAPENWETATVKFTNDAKLENSVFEFLTGDCVKASAEQKTIPETTETVAEKTTEAIAEPDIEIPEIELTTQLIA